MRRQGSAVAVDIDDDNAGSILRARSAGDASYARAVQGGNDLYIDYHTSDVDRDWFWLMGMVSASEIRTARINLPALEKVAQARASADQEGLRQID